MPTYNDIPLIESQHYIQDYVERIAHLDLELAGKMKYAIEFALQKATADGYDQGFRDGNVGPSTISECDEEVPF